jgi:hypothetical protein
MHRAERRSITGCILACAVLLCGAGAMNVTTAVAQIPASPAPNAQSPSQPPSGAPVAAAPAQTADWKTYSFDAEGFSASFPTEPVKEKQPVTTDAGTFELRTYMAASDAVALYIGVCDYGDAAKGGDPDAILEGAKNGAVSNVHAHLIDSKKVTLGIYPGVAFEAAGEGAHLYGRIYLVGSTLYQAFVALQSDRPYADTKRFLDSFQLIPRTSP